MTEPSFQAVDSQTATNSSTKIAQSTHPGGENPLGWSDLLVLLGSAIYLYLNLFSLAAKPFLLTGDQVFFWMDAQRMLYGEHIYRDFFQFTPPGTDLFYLSLFKLFGPRIAVPNVAVFFLGIVLCWVCFRIAKLVMTQQYAALAAAIFLVLLYGKLLNATHHWFSVLAVLVAVAILLKRRTSVTIAIAGTLLGAASIFTQTRGPVAALGIAIFLIWDRSRTQGSWRNYLSHLRLLFISLAVTWLTLSGYFIATTGLRQLLYFQITYVRHFMVSGWTPSMGLPEAVAWRRLPVLFQYLFVYAMLPLVYAACLLKCWTHRQNKSFETTQRVMLLTLVGLALCLEVAQSPNWLRVYCVAMPGIILLIWLTAEVQRPWFWSYTSNLLWVGIITLALLQIGSRHHRQTEIVKLPAGEVATAPAVAEKMLWLTEQTRPGQFFFQAAWPGVYIPLGLRNPVFLDELETGDQTRPDYVDLSIQQLKTKQVRYILWSPRLNSPDAFQGSRAYHLIRFREFLTNSYQRVWTFPDLDEVWERK